MRIIHTSDWHLGQYFYGKSRAPEHQQFLNWLLNQVTQHQVDAVIVAGDVFDTGSPPSYAREMYFDFIVALNKCQCQLVVLAGNHDSVAMLGESKQLLAGLSTRVIPAVTDNIDEQVFTLCEQQGKGQLVVCAVPFIRPRDVIKSRGGQSAKQKQQSLQQGIKQHYDTLFASAQKLSQQHVDEQGQGLAILATGHLTTVGVSSSESVRDIYIGTLEAFPANAFPNADYIALGHIHRPQAVAKTEHIRYSGSPIPLSFDETKQNKQVQLVEFAAGKLKNLTPLVIPRFQAMTMVKTDLNTLKQDIEQAIEQALAQGTEQATELARVAAIATSISGQQTNIIDATRKPRVWLDIEISSADYLQDIGTRIAHIIEDLPADILLVRRSKKSRQAMPSEQQKATLNELTLEQVFDARLDFEDWPGEQSQQQRQRITQLFHQAVQDVQAKEAL
jgi:exonuclease SbcD